LSKRSSDGLQEAGIAKKICNWILLLNFKSKF
jgi:hypothetical protein